MVTAVPFRVERLQATRYDHRTEVQADTSNILIVGGGGSSNTWELRSSNGSFLNSGSLNNTRSGGHTMTQY
jgi:ATP-dependent protease Clp ATPase subunit